jgi:phosphoglycolate phosphatase
VSRPLVIFDCDGTLVDGQHTIHEAMQAAFMLHDLAPPARDDVRHVVGLRLDHAIARLYADGSEAAIAAVAQSYRDVFARLRQRPGYDEPMFPGMRDLILDLAGRDVLLGVATGKSLRGLCHTLAMHGIVDRFATLQTPDNAPGKPDPGMVLQAMSQTGAAAASTFVVGDTSFDMEMARAAGVAAIGVGWGYHDPVHLMSAGARHIAADIGELALMLDGCVGERHAAAAAP